MGTPLPYGATDELKTDDARLLKEGPILLYDGECGVCNQAIQWILKHERHNTLRFAPLKSRLGLSLRALAKVPGTVDSLLWIENRKGEVSCKLWSDSIIATTRYVGGPWSLVSYIQWFPKPLRDAGYKLFAKHRLQFAPKTCALPSAEESLRFLDR